MRLSALMAKGEYFKMEQKAANEEYQGLKYDMLSVLVSNLLKNHSFESIFSMVHRTGLNESLAKQMNWFTLLSQTERLVGENDKTVHRTGLNSSFIQQNDWSTFKLDWMT